MTYPQATVEPILETSAPVISITFCSCTSCRTQLEQIPTKGEIAVMWLKDAAAGASFVLFMIGSFVLAGGAHALLKAI